MKSKPQFLGGTPVRDGYGEMTTVVLFLPLIASQHGVCWDLNDLDMELRSWKGPQLMTKFRKEEAF